jgi:hypothetical protein
MLDLWIALGSPTRDPFTQESQLSPINDKLAAIKEWPEIRGRACALFGEGGFKGETWDRLIEWLEAEHGKTWDATSSGKPEDHSLTTGLGQILDWLAEAARPPKGAGIGGRPHPKGKRGRGRKPDTSPKADKRVADAWATGQYKTYEGCGIALGMTKKQVKDAIDRHRKRQPAKRRKQSQAPE